MAKGKKTGGRNFQKGVVTNPNGRPRLAPEVKIVRSLNQAKLITLMNQYVGMNKEELKEKELSKDTTVLELMVIKVIQYTINKGDQMRLSFLLDRIVGKVPTAVDVSLNPDIVGHIKEFESKSSEELLAIVEEMIKTNKIE